MQTKKIVKSPKGRRCRYPECKRELSIYNHAPHCHIHQNRISATAWGKGVEPKFV